MERQTGDGYTRDIGGGEDAVHRKEEDRSQGGDGDRDGFGEPPRRHGEDDACTPHRSSVTLVKEQRCHRECKQNHCAHHEPFHAIQSFFLPRDHRIAQSQLIVHQQRLLCITTTANHHAIVSHCCVCVDERGATTMINNNKCSFSFSLSSLSLSAHRMPANINTPMSWIDSLLRMILPVCFV